MAAPKNRISEILDRVLGKYLESQNRPRKYGLKVLLYPSEMDMMTTIGRFPEAGVTELAERTGVTKGAISQMVQKLENKRLISRVHDPKNRKRIAFRLTSQGYTAFYNNEKRHEEAGKELHAFLTGLSPDDSQLLEDFLLKLEQGIEKTNES